MKKFLVVLLACALIFGFATTALAADSQITEFNDIADQTLPARNAIMKLAVLGVIEGNEGIGGAFRPADNLTRAEFAKIVCYLTDNVKIAESLAGVGSKFSDVSTGNWYTGWVNAAAQSGYYVGDPGGTFRPNANITMQEVVTVALRCAGYNDKLPGTWPGNYVAKASNVGLLDDVTFVGSSPATRSDMAIICNEVLGINMVVHIDSEIAFGLSLAQGTADPDGFSEIYYVSNETYREKTYETILHKAFKGEYYAVQFQTAWALEAGDEEYDEVIAWGYEDFDSTELGLRPERVFVDTDFKQYGYKNDNGDWVDYTYSDAEDLASTYYITGGFDLPELAGMQAEIIVIDNEEICFVEMYSSYETASSIYIDSGRVLAGGKSYRPSDTMGVSNSVKNVVDYSDGYIAEDATDAIQDFAGSDKDNDFGGKLYLDKNGRVYAVKNYDAYNDVPFGIFDQVDSNIADWKNAYAGFEKLETNKNYAIYKDGEFIKAEDLNENDLVTYLGDSVGAKFYLATAPAEGELTQQTSSKLTLAGTGYKTVTDFQYSDDGGESFDTFVMSSSAPEVDFGEAEYAKAYNFNRLAYVAANTAGNKIIGVVTKITPAQEWSASKADYEKQYQEITIYNAEGKEVTYKFTSDFRDGYNWKVEQLTGVAFKHGSAGQAKWDSVNNWDRAKATGMAEQVGAVTEQGIAKGDIVQLSVNSSDQVKKLANYAAFDASAAAKDVKVQSSRSRITFGNTTYSLNADAAIFNVTTDDKDYDDVGLKTTASVLAADFTAVKVVAFDMKTNGDVTALYIIGDVSEYQFGVITGQGRDSTGTYYTVNGKRVYSVNMTASPVPSVIAYTVSGSEATIGKYLTLGSGANSYLNEANIPGYVEGNSNKNWFAAVGLVPANGYSSTTKALNVNGTYVYVTSDTYLYDIVKDDTCDPADLRGYLVVAVYDKNGDALFAARVGRETAAPLTDKQAVAADKALIEAGTYVIPFADQTSQITKTAWVQNAVNARIQNGTAATVTWDATNSIYVVALAKGTETGTANITVTEDLTDVQAVAADKALIEAGTYVIPLANQTNQTTKTAWVRAAVNAKIANGTTAVVTFNAGAYGVALSKGSVTDTATITVTDETAALTDAQKVAADKGLIEPGTYVIPLANQTSQATKTAWVQAAVNALIANGTTAVVTWDGSGYEVILTLGTIVDSATITVTEEDLTAPVFAGVADANVAVASAATWDAATGVTATDNIDGDVTASITITYSSTDAGSTVTNLTSARTHLGTAGNTVTATYSVTDAAGNTATATATFTAI